MGAFDDYQPQASKGGAFADYPPTSAPGAASASPYDPNWKPSGNAVWDLLTRPVAKTEDPFSAARDAAMSAFDAGTFGYGPKALGMQDAAAQAHQNMGLMDYPTDALAYAAGPGKILGPAARLAARVVPAAAPTAGVLARAAPSIVAGGVEGATAGGLGAAGHGGDVGDIAKSAIASGALGAATGVLGGLGPTPKPPEVGSPAGTDVTGVPTPPTGMYAAKEAGYKPLDSVYFDSHGGAISRAQTVIANARDPQGIGAPLGIPKDVTSILADPNGLGSPVVTGRTIQQASRDLRDTGDWTAHRFADQLDNTLRYDQPMAGGQPGDAWAAKQAGDLWHGRIQDLERLSAETPSGTPGPTPVAVAKTMQNYDPGSPQYDALTALQSSMKPSFNWWHLRHPAGALLGAGVGEVEDLMNPDEHHNPWANAFLHAGAGAALFSGLPALAAARPGAALNAAKYAIGTGQPITTSTGRLSDALANLWFGQGARGGF